MADLNLAEVIKQAVTLLDSDNVIAAAEGLKKDTPEKEIAADYVTGYAQFLKDVVDTDIAKGRIRPDYEIRELIGHVNAMLKQKQHDVFMKMVLNSPKHYKAMMQPHP